MANTDDQTPLSPSAASPAAPPSSPPSSSPSPAPSKPPRRKAPSRGGYRPGAGRRPSGLPPARTVSAALPGPLADRLDAWIAAHPAVTTPSRSSAIAQLLAAALDAALDALDHHGARSQPPASTPSLPAPIASPPDAPPSPPSLPSS